MLDIQGAGQKLAWNDMEAIWSLFGRSINSTAVKKNGTKTFKHGRALNYNFPLVKFAMA
jgi:hypothetical protein